MNRIFITGICGFLGSNLIEIMFCFNSPISLFRIINAELKNGQARALDLKKNQESVEGEESMAEIQKSTSIVEPVFIQGLKELIHQIAFGKIKLK